MLSCHRALNKIKAETDFTFALAGNPNVGKSTIFSRLTGMGVVTANYPGKTVELAIGTTEFAGHKIGIVDLPGTYAIGAVSDDQWVARQGVLEGDPDVVILIVDATNLTRNLYMALQFIDLGLPVVIALNLVDQAERAGVRTDAREMSKRLGVPVIPTVATQGKGIDELMRTALELVNGSFRTQRPTHYGHDVEEAITLLAGTTMAQSSELRQEMAQSSEIPGEMPRHAQHHRRRHRGHGHVHGGNGLPHGLGPRAIALLLLEDDHEFAELVEAMPGGRRVTTEAARLRAQVRKRHGEQSPTRIARERYGLAGSIASQVQKAEPRPVPLPERLWAYTTAPLTGLPILGLVLVSVFAFLFYVGTMISNGLSALWAATASPVIDSIIFALAGSGTIAKTLIWGFDAGLLAILSVGIPYVLTFYLMLAVLEDTGYLNSVAFLTDRLMHRLGLHGRAVIPLIAGAGCNVPAIIGTRALTTNREKLIASTLITLVPCSARTAVIIGSVSLVAGWRPAAAIFLTTGVLLGLVGIGLNRILPGTSTGLVMEMFPFRMPSASTMAKKTWHRVKDFIFVATPIVLVGSIALGGLYETGYIWLLSAPLKPVVEGWLGLPAVAGLTLVFAVLRKELALQLLIALAIVQYGKGAASLTNFMNVNQIFVYALVNTIYIPCVATIAVLARELSWKRALLIMTFTISLAILAGGIAIRLLNLLNPI